MTHKPGSFCWIELATTDPASAKQFYSDLSGWTFTDNPMGPGEVYTIFQLDGKDTGAAFKIGMDVPKFPPRWNLYMAVEDAAAAASKVALLGGKVVREPCDVSTLGRMAVVEDPAGAAFCIWQPNQHQGIGIAGEENAFCWADLITADVGKAKPFYEQLFGWELSAAKNDSSGYFPIHNGNNSGSPQSEVIGGVPAQAPSHGAPSHWLLYFQTSDCDGATQNAERHGARVSAPPMAIPGAGRFSALADPQGAIFARFEPQSAA